MRAKDLHALRVRFLVEGPVDLPCLPTVMIRSVLGRALRDLSCVSPARAGCAGCREHGACAYGLLFEPAPIAAREHGVTNAAPPPLILAPEAAVVGKNQLRLSSQDTLDVRVVLIGRARAHASLVVAALRAAGARGIGPRRTPLALVEAREVDVRLSAPGASATIELLTPLRLTAGGRVRSRFDAREFLDGLRRRLDTLSALYGIGPARMPGIGRIALELAKARVVPVQRWSSRQQGRMTLPGLMANLVLRGELREVWPSLAWGEWVQLGKGTSMGFGRYRLRAMQA